jgi:hypothetical protein
MKKKKLIKILHAAGFKVARDTRIANDTGWRLDMIGGAIVDVFDSGTVNIQGGNLKKIRAIKAHLGIIKRSPNGKRTDRAWEL